jgi:hypothetical protein
MRILTFCLLVSALIGSSAAAQDADAYIRSDRLGITFISSADHPASDARYQNALLLGAGWNRYPFYWERIETSPGNFDYGAYDPVVAADLAYGLQTNAILIGIPGFYRQGETIQNLGAPVFSDGSDTPAPGKTINPDNYWARFVYTTVNRYKPGGLMGADGIRVWEAWNEPDFDLFWRGGVEQYARLLKVTYLAAHHADAEAQVMFGGLAYIDPASDDWLARTLNLIASDPARDSFNWYMDIVAVHNYSNPWRSGWVVRHAREVLARYGITRPIWLNESGVPAWDDYPGPTWATDRPDERRLRATMQQQAHLVIQGSAYAFAEGAEVVMYHQLYDDCGNQPAGTNFPPHNGELCAGGGICAGDAHGLFRNERGDICFSQHPLPGTARPSATAFRVLAQVFGDQPIGTGTVLAQGNRATVIVFERPERRERVYVLWNRSLDRLTIDLPASGRGATLYAADNRDFYIEPTDGRYTIGLPAATRDDYPFLQPGEVSAIGGAPFILVETFDQPDAQFNPALVNLEPYNPDAGDIRGVGGFGLPVGERIQPTPGSILGGSSPAQPPAPTPPPAAPTQPPAPTPTALLRPTVDPASDTTPPQTSMSPLPIISPPTFTVAWSGRDESGIAAYTVWVRIDRGEWSVWLENTSETTAQYSGTPGSSYEFAVWAVDLAGNWSPNVELTAQASTAVQ